MNFNKKIAEIRKFLNLSNAGLEKKLSLSNGYISNIEKNGTDNPGKLLIALSEIGISTDWFLTGKGEMLTKKVDKSTANSAEEARLEVDKSTHSAKVNNLTSTSDQENLPIQESLKSFTLESTAPKFAELEEKIDGKLGNLQKDLQSQINELKEAISKQCGFEKYAEEVKEVAPLYTADVPYEEPEETAELPLAENLAAGFPIEAFTTSETFPVPVRFLKRRKKYCVAKIKGTTMTEAGIADGAYVLLEINETPVSGSIVLARYGNRTTLKRLREKETGGWELCYEDGSGAVIPLKDGEWEVIGWFVRVVGK